MLRSLNRLRRDEDGQALVIAAIGLLIMAIGVLATAQIGYAVYQRQKLQTLADAQAYTLAAMHARAFNFIAFTNRAMVANYVMMMHLQGIVSAMTVQEVYAGLIADQAHEDCAFSNCPYVEGAVLPLCDAATILNTTRAGITSTLNAFDSLAKQQITLLNTQNTLLYTAQASFVTTLTAVNLLSQVFNQLFGRSDSGLDLGVSTAVSAMLNENTLGKIFDTTGSQMLPVPKVQPKTPQGDAAAIVSEIVNATRVEAQNFLPLRRDNTANSIGQSRMLQDPTEGTAETFNDKLPTGSALFSKDSMTNPAGGLAAVVQVQNDLAQGVHQRYWGINFPWNPLPICESDRIASARAAPTQADMTDGNHRGWNGIGKFISLNPSNVQAVNKDFGQHGVVAWLNKKSDKLTRREFTQKFTLDWQGGQKKLDSTIGGSTGISLLTGSALNGINAVAAAQVYYHRPGYWREVPNLFNPFWKARLYPVAQWMNNWVADGQLSGDLMTLLQGNMIIH
jgi:hypothetical protein